MKTRDPEAGLRQPSSVSSDRPAKIADSRGLLRQIYTALPYPISLIDRDYRYLLVNDIYADFYDISSDKIIGRYVKEFIDKKVYTQEILPRFEQCLSGKEVEYILALNLAGKGERNLEIHYSPFREDSGEVTGIISHITDITERRAAEEALRESEARFRNIFNQTFQLCGILNLDGTVIAANQTSLDFISAREEEVLGRPFWDTPWWTHSGELQAWLKKAVARAARGKSERKEVTHRAPDGKIHYFDFSLKPFRDLSGEIRYLIPESRNITGRIQAEKASAAALNQLRLFIDSSPDLCFLKDLEGRYLIVNTANARFFGREESEILGRTDFELMPEDAASNCRKSDQQAASRREMVINTETVGERIYETRKIPVINDGRLIKVAGIVRDITEQAYLRREKNRLEQQFQQAQRLESIGRLAGGIAHDLNNLLTPILGYGDLLREPEMTDDKRIKMAGEIVLAGERARDMVRQLLAFSRKQTLAFESIDLNVLLGKFKELLQRTIRENITISFHPDRTISMVRGDPGQLEQVIMNLAVNAQDAMPDGGYLSLETSEVELDADYAAAHQGVEPGRYVLMAVSDTGHGMDKDILKYLFEPFFTTKSKENGTGLGLSTAYGIIKQHGGNIWVYSEPGHGTTFKIYLPVWKRESLHRSHQGGDSGKARGTETILLVEDNEQVRNLAQTILERQGYKVIQAENGPAALALLETFEGPLDLLLTDVIMLGMNGRQLYEQVAETHPETKALFMSGYTENVIESQGVKDQQVHFLQKPFSIRSLSSKIRELLDGE